MANFPAPPLNGLAETFVVCPVAGKERAEEAEQRNQKQTCIADLKLILSEENVPLVQLARGVSTSCPYGVC